MDVFFSWSGNRSHQIAKVLSEWLRGVIQAVEPWVSDAILKGKRWSPEIREHLEKSKVGIVCLTPDNLRNPWILFEAGALSKTNDAYVCTFLTDLTPADVEHPLAQFEHTENNQADIKRLIQTINSAVGKDGEKQLPEQTLDDVFITFWPRLVAGLAKVPKPTKGEAKTIRSDRELLEETLEILRRMDRPRTIPTIGGDFEQDLVPGYSEALALAAYQSVAKDPKPRTRVLRHIPKSDPSPRSPKDTDAK